jgi:spoIIIJ-associated protein
MPLTDKIAAAKKIDALLKSLIRSGAFRLRYRITVDPPVSDDRDWERPAILVDFSGPDSELVLEHGAELLRAFENVVQEMLRLAPNEHEQVVFDCMGHRESRVQELKLAAGVAAERVRKTGVPYQFAPMTSRERRILHLALRDAADLTTDSQGMGSHRCVVVAPKNAKSPTTRTSAGAITFRKR